MLTCRLSALTLKLIDPGRSFGVGSKMVSEIILAEQIALDINGIVRLDGEVDDEATHELAIKLASDIRGVREVRADQLRVAKDA